MANSWKISRTTYGLGIWDKDDSRVREIRATRDLPYTSYTSYTTYTTYTSSPEEFANLMITLCYKQLYLMERFIAGNEQRFIKEGGFRENLFKKRINYRKNNL